MKRYLIEYAADLPDVIEAESLEDAENEILNNIAIFEEVKMKTSANITIITVNNSNIVWPCSINF